MAKHNHENGIVQLNTWDLIKGLFNKNKIKNKVSLENLENQPKITQGINHIAIVLDGEVKEIIRAQNRLASLFLSNPEFVEFDLKEVHPQIGWKYIDGKFEDDSENKEN
jgi:hypothetical protein